MEQQAVYRESWAYAAEAGEAKLYWKSHELNVACKEAIEQAFNSHYDYKTYHLDSSFVPGLVNQFGADRVEWVLANTVQKKEHDGRFSHKNLEWAKTVPLPEDKSFSGSDNRVYYMVDKINPGMIDMTIGEFRQAIDAAREQPERKPSIKEQLAAPPVHGEKPRTPGRDKGAR